MSIALLTTLIASGALLAGFLGALTGLGGGVIIVPLLALVFGVNLHYAIGASLIAVIATSSGSAAAYVKAGFANIRIGMFLEVATTLGALLGATLAIWLPSGAIAVVFGVVLLYSVYQSLRKRQDEEGETLQDPLATRLKLNGSIPGPSGPQPYNTQHVPQGFALMGLAGALSGLLGIGSGAVKVLAMDRAMGLPFKVSTTTSNFMIGVTAAASAGIYLHRGYIDPTLAVPVMLGVLVGSQVGTRVLMKTSPQSLRKVFAVVLLALGVEMIVNGLTGRL
jgi:uncharacterized membrane protein YfcA